VPQAARWGQKRRNPNDPLDTLTMDLLLRELFSFKAAIDILLVSVGLFFLYRTLLRQGTWKIVTGIILAVILFLIANLLDLRGIEWIYSNLSPGGCHRPDCHISARVA
jgi:DNA integrity scanning protein DisA with diadenylate cyclase activity